LAWLLNKYIIRHYTTSFGKNNSLVAFTGGDQINPQDQNINASNFLGFIVLSTHGYNIYSNAMKIHIEWEQVLEAFYPTIKQLPIPIT
jgi:hypothetical protein